MIANLFVISGPSGVGKDTLMAFVLNGIPNLKRWVTVTTRSPREGEIEGVHYFYKTKEEFLDMVDSDKLVEWNKYSNNYYGTPKDFVVENINSGNSVITTIDVNGAMNVKKSFPNANLIFILPPSIKDLEKRLSDRGTESKEQIANRLSIAKSELKQAPNFNKQFINDDLQTCANEIIEYINQHI